MKNVLSIFTIVTIVSACNSGNKITPDGEKFIEANTKPAVSRQAPQDLQLTCENISTKEIEARSLDNKCISFSMNSGELSLENKKEIIESCLNESKQFQDFYSTNKCEFPELKVTLQHQLWQMKVDTFEDKLIDVLAEIKQAKDEAQAQQRREENKKKCALVKAKISDEDIVKIRFNEDCTTASHVTQKSDISFDFEASTPALAQDTISQAKTLCASPTNNAHELSKTVTFLKVTTFPARNALRSNKLEEKYAHLNLEWNKWTRGIPSLSVKFINFGLASEFVTSLNIDEETKDIKVFSNLEHTTTNPDDIYIIGGSRSFFANVTMAGLCALQEAASNEEVLEKSLKLEIQ